jgi:beta-mannanase
MGLWSGSKLKKEYQMVHSKRTLSIISKIFNGLLFLLVITTPIFVVTPAYSQNRIDTSVLQNKIYIPIVMKDYLNLPTYPHLLGVTISAYYPNDINKITGIDGLAGKQHSVVGTFISLSDIDRDPYNHNFIGQLESLYQHGYMPFVNLANNSTMADFASGKLNSSISNAARLYAAWVKQGGGRSAMIAPLNEMNYPGSTYSQPPDPTNFKIVYKIFHDLFAQAGVPSNSIFWVFAPNGYSDPGFEAFYPGKDLVDIVAFSSYNFGSCPIVRQDWMSWDNWDKIYKPYIDRMRIMAPGKPIIISQTGTTGYANLNDYDRSAKNQWLLTNYQYLMSQPDILAVLYFDMDTSKSYDCDWAVYNVDPGHQPFDGYKQVGALPNIQYLSPANLLATLKK